MTLVTVNRVNRRPGVLYGMPLAIGALCLVLSACQVTITPPPVDVIDVTVDSDVTEPKRRDSVAAGEVVRYRFDIPSSLAGNDLLTVEVVSEGTTPLRLTALDTSGNAAYTSTTALYFAPAGAEAASVTPATVGVTPLCGGPCVQVRIPPGGGRARFDVRSLSGGDSYALYAYVSPFADSNDPANDTEAGAALITGSDTGAIETVGDEDWFSSSAVVTRVTLASSFADLDIRAEIYSEAGDTITTIPAGEAFTIPSFPQRLRARVYSGNDRAASAGNSLYTITFD